MKNKLRSIHLKGVSIGILAFFQVGIQFGQAQGLPPNSYPNTITVSGGILNYDFYANNGGIIIENSGVIVNFAHIDNFGDIENSGTIKNFGDIKNIHSIGNSGGIENFGDIDNYNFIDNIGIIENFGTITNDRVIDNSGFIINYNGGTISNVGIIENRDSNTIYNYGVIINTGGIINDGFLDTTNSIFENFFVLSGSGSQMGDLDDYKVMAPGDAISALVFDISSSPSLSPGVYTIDGNYRKHGGSFEIELSGLSDGNGNKSLTEYDWIDVTGYVDILSPSVFELSFIDGFVAGDLSLGDRFDILRFNSLSGFGNLSIDDSLAMLAPGMAWELGMDASSVYLTTVTVATPDEVSTFALTAFSLLLLGQIRTIRKRSNRR